MTNSVKRGEGSTEVIILNGLKLLLILLWDFWLDLQALFSQAVQIPAIRYLNLNSSTAFQ
jgi:hypothetical protein